MPWPASGGCARPRRARRYGRNWTPERPASRPKQATRLDTDNPGRGPLLTFPARFLHEGALMDLHLAGKVAVVTGAGKGIGLAVTRALAAEGALVFAGSRKVESLEGIDGVTPVAGDLAAEDGPAALVGRALEEGGRLDVLVNKR